MDTTNSSSQEMTVINFSEERTVFERAIIEAFKQKGSRNIYEKLSIALDEIKFIVLEIKKTFAKNKKYLMNKNILDKLSRISERKYFNVNILIAKIYENILDPNNFEILSNDVNLLINISNEILNLLENIRSTIVSRQLEKKCSAFLNYLLQIEGISEEQKITINDLLSGFPTRHSSNVYKNFESLRDKILKLTKNSSVDDKMEGLNLLMENYGNTSSLEEQFDLLIEKVSAIIKAIIHQPNPEYKEAYFQLGNFICSILYATKFKIEAFLPDYKINHKELNKNFFFFLAGDEIVDESTKYHVSFLHNTTYELTTQKEILTKCENIFQICNLIVNTLSIYDSIFDLQFVCYIILKRVYFTFPQFRKNIEDSIAATLINLCLFKDAFEVENSEECKLFLHYLLENGDEELQHKIRKRIESRGVNISLKNEVDEKTRKEVEFECLKLSDFNLRIGYPNCHEIEAGAELSKYIEVLQPNSIVYIGFATQSNDITFHLMKYIPNEEEEKPQEEEEDDYYLDNIQSEENEEFTDKGHFKQLLKLERIDSSLTPVKCVMFVPEPGTYKLIFDNSYSWFTGKTLRYRISVLQPLCEIDLNKRFEFEKLKNGFKAEERGISNTDNQMESNIESNIHENKILMVKLDGVNRSYNLGKIYNSEKAIQENANYLTIPVIFSKDSFRIFMTSTDEHGRKNYDFREFKINDNEEEKEKKTLSEMFEEQMSLYISSINDLENKVIFLSTFILDKFLTSSSQALPVTSDESYKIIFNKLGFFPENLLSKFENVRFFTTNFADACLLYLIYDKILIEEKFGNIIHIHFDKLKTQASLYFEGVINDKISGLNYESDKTLLENVENVIEFVNRVIAIFGPFTLSISYSDIDDK